MKSLSLKKQVILILMLLLPTIALFGSVISRVNAGPMVPEPDPKNGWHWGVDEGDILMYEFENIFTNWSNGEVLAKYRNIMIFNITSITDVTTDHSGLYPLRNYSQLEVTLLWENPVNQLESSGMVWPMGYFGYHPGDSQEEKYNGGYSYFPIAFPLNDTTLNVTLMADILQDSFYDPMWSAGRMNKWETYWVNTGQNSIHFRNSTNNCFIDAEYYVNNGTLKESKAFYLMNMGGPDFTAVNGTAKRVFEYDTTDEIAWSIDVGDTLYYHMNDTWGGYQLAKLDIIGFNKEIYWSRNWTYPNDNPVPMTFETVYVNISVWNETHYDLMMADVPLSAANNFYPMCFPIMEMMGGGGGMMIMPTSATIDDFIFLINNETRRLLGYPMYFPFDIIIYDVIGEIANMELIQIGGQSAIARYNFSSGMIESQAMYDMGKLTGYVERARYFPDWPVDIGDVLYYKQYMEVMHPAQQETRITITEFDGELFNMTELAEILNMMGYQLILPPEQPELQFFMEVIGEYAFWDYEYETWMYMDETVLAISNEYWPMMPFVIGMGIPLVLPKGVVATDFQPIFGILASMFNDISYTTNHIILKNTTENKELHFYFDGAEGKTTLIIGDNYAGPSMGWFYMSAYLENVKHLNPGTNTFTLQSNFVTDTIGQAEIPVAIGTPGTDYIYALLDKNPVGINLPVGTPLLFMDQKITNTSLLSGNITYTITLAPTLDLDTLDIFFWAWNMSGLSTWDAPPPDWEGTVIYDYANNRIIFEFPVGGPFAVISAISYDIVEPEPEEPEEIPGYDLFLISLLIVIVSGILLKKKRKKL